MKKLILKKPLILGTLTITELNFRDDTTAEDYLAFDQRGPVAQRLSLIASLTGSDLSLIKKLKGVDYRRATAIADQMLNQDELDEQAAEIEENPVLTDAQVAAEKK